MKCFICKSDTVPAPFDTVPPFSKWHKCQHCGSYTADREYDKGLYPDGFSQSEVQNQSIEERRVMCDHNAQWFDKFAGGIERTFLDVGCGDGAMLDVMAARGWAVHGFDVCKPHYIGPHITVGPLFNRWLFPRRYGAVNAREVIEHVEWPNLLLHELHGACLPGGLVQIQTPTPVEVFDPLVHAVGHLFVVSPPQLRSMIKEAYLDILDEQHWEAENAKGQAYLCRAKG